MHRASIEIGVDEVPTRAPAPTLRVPFARRPHGRFAAIWRRLGRALRRHAGAVCWLTALGALTAPACAASPDPAVAEAVGVRTRALARAHAAVVGVEAVAIEDAPSAATLGRNRLGSGVVIGDDGLVLTIGYLIVEADHVDLVASNGHRFPARVVAYDLATGFGLLQSLAPLALVPAPLGASASLSNNEPLMIASGGNIANLSLARLISQRAFAGYWEYRIDGALFTAPLRTDHSGAGLFNADGELMGIGSLVVSDAAGPGAAGVQGNMFVPVDLLKPILAELRERGTSQGSKRAWLGVSCVEVAGHLRVIRVAESGPADQAGLRAGDEILSLDGSEAKDLESFYKALWQGDSVEREVALTIRRHGDELTVKVMTADRLQTLKHPQGI